MGGVNGPEEGAQRREERVEARYQEACWAGLSKHDLAGQLVDAEDALKRLNTLACDLVDHADENCAVLPERDRYRTAWLSARAGCKRALGAWRYAEWHVRATREESRKADDFTRELWDWFADRGKELTRMRTAWLSARRRAARESVYATEALALRDAEIADLRAQVRELTHGVSDGPLHLGL